MTWTKFGTEFFKECLHHGLSDAMVRTHCEAIDYLYAVEEMSLKVPKRMVRTFTGSEDANTAIELLVTLEWWADRGDSWEVLHHADVVRQSLAAQQKQRSVSKETSRKYRQKKAQQEPSEGEPVTRHVTPNADSQTDKQLQGDQTLTCKHEYRAGAWVSPLKQETGCSACQEEKRTA